MSTTDETPRARLWRRVLITILVVTCIRVWIGPAETVPRAVAQIPDPGLQRNIMVEELRHANMLLGEILLTLKTHPIKVQVQGTDKTEGRSAVRPPGKP
jgi:hypothetical protein